jgi:hypothetical protein
LTHEKPLPKLAATFAGGLFDVIKGMNASHSGQSSQLVSDANTRNAQFLPPLARNGLTVIGSKKS